MGNAGRREFIQVLRLMENFTSIRSNRRSPKRCVLARNLTFYPYLPAATVGATDPRHGSSPMPAPRRRPREFRHDNIAEREYEKVAMKSAQDRADYPRYLLRLCELERIDRERRNVERRIRLARFSQTKSLDTFDFAAQPSLNKPLVLELTRCEWIEKRKTALRRAVRNR